MAHKFKKTLLTVALGSVLLQGCQATGDKKAQNSTIAGFGALALCLMTGESAAKCTAIGIATGAAAYAIQVIVENKKTETAQSVNAEAMQANKAIPEDDLEALSFDVGLSPQQVVKAGDKVALKSHVKLYGNGTQKVEQSTQLYDEDMEPVGKPRVEAFKADGSAAGGYTSVANYTIPEGWSGQKFNFKTAVLVNGEEVASQDNVQMTVLAEIPANSVAVLASR